jgi:hypothetical protein
MSGHYSILSDCFSLTPATRAETSSGISSQMSIRIKNLVKRFNSRTERFKEKAIQPPTPSSTSSAGRSGRNTQAHYFLCHIFIIISSLRMCKYVGAHFLCICCSLWWGHYVNLTPDVIGEPLNFSLKVFVMFVIKVEHTTFVLRDSIRTDVVTRWEHFKGLHIEQYSSSLVFPLTIMLYISRGTINFIKRWTWTTC